MNGGLYDPNMPEALRAPMKQFNNLDLPERNELETTEIISRDAARPTCWGEYIGQHAMKKRLKIHAEAANRRNEAMDHVLLLGPAGVGKTSIAALIAQEAGAPFRSYMAPLSDDGFMTLIDFKGCVLMDEIHAMSPKGQERFLTIIEDGYYQYPSGVKQDTSMLTIIAATTEYDKVIKPLQQRFQIKPQFEDYTREEMGRIAQGMGQRMGVYLDDNTALAYAKAGGGSPRIVREMMTMARDSGSTDPAVVFDYLGINEYGLTKHHLRYLETLASMNHQAGVAKLTSSLGYSQSVLLELEAVLLSHGFIKYNNKGRVLTPSGAEQI